MTSKSSYCPIPFIHQFISTDGISYCCASERKKDINLDEFETSEYLAKVREDITTGKIPDGCQNCHNQEKMGITSLRMSAIAEYGFDTFGPPISYLDLRYNNLCNLGCRMCGPEFSSTWEKQTNEHQELRQFLASPTRVEYDQILEHVEKNIHNLKKINFTGGEPLLIKEHLDVIRLLVKYGKTKEIGIATTSNLSVTNSQWFQLLSDFQDVHWTISLDGIENVAEYIRWPCQWKVIDENIKKLLKFNNNSIHINATLSIYALLDLSNLVRYYLYLKKNIRGDGYFSFTVGTCDYPKHLSMNAIPMEFREKIHNELLKARDLLENDPDSKSAYDTFNGLINYKNHPNDLLIKQFWSYTNTLDKIRNQNFNSTFKAA